MPKSKTDKSRKEKVLKFKKSKQMSKKAPEMAPFRQVPVWNSDDKFEINGDELNSFYTYFSQFFPSINAIQQIFARGIQEGKIKMNYEYEDGKPVPEGEVAEYTKKLQEYFQAKAVEAQEASQEETNEPSTEETKPEAKIVSLTGEKVSIEKNS